MEDAALGEGRRTTPVYADHASTSYPTLWPASATESYANPSNVHGPGRAARAALDEERRALRRLLNLGRPAAKGEEEEDALVFTSGGTEGNNLVLQGAPWRYIVTAATEHSSVTFTAQFLAVNRQPSCDVVFLPVGPTGLVDPADVERAVRGRRGPGLLSLMLVNNEVGVVQDIAALVRAARRAAPSPQASAAGEGLYVHTDAVQAPGHVPVDVAALGVDFLTLGAHKFHGPVGVGLLYCRWAGVLGQRPLLHGGHQQQGLRPGTESVVLARALRHALADALGGLPERQPRLRAMAAMVWRALLPFVVTGLVLPTGPPAGSRERAPHHVSFCVRGVHRTELLARLERAGVIASGGSACSNHAVAAADLPSPVLVALGVPDAYIHGSVRLTFSHTNREEEVAALVCPALVSVLCAVAGVAAANKTTTNSTSAQVGVGAGLARG